MDAHFIKWLNAMYTYIVYLLNPGLLRIKKFYVRAFTLYHLLQNNTLTLKKLHIFSNVKCLQYIKQVGTALDIQYLECLSQFKKHR